MTRATGSKDPDSMNDGGDLFIVDNADKRWKVSEYLREWTGFSRAFDIATGYFEIGSLLELEGAWSKVEKIRILMGDEVSGRTKRVLINDAAGRLDASLEDEKERNVFLNGVPAILEALQRGQIEVRVFAKRKFHAKTYITHGTSPVVGSVALVGSSNFTRPGLTDNIELNIQVKHEVQELQRWFEHYWSQAEEVREEFLRVIERQVHEYPPFDVYARALHEFFRGHQTTDSEWERGHSRLYAKLSRYQQEGYHHLIEKLARHRGAFLSDGVGLGKTFIGMMAIERLISRDRKRVALFVSKSARKPVWESALTQYLPGLSGAFSNLEIFNHTDLNRGGDYAERLEQVRQLADVIVIDEAHHFRNSGSQRYEAMRRLTEGKQVLLLTATPVNNSLDDLRSQIELFTGGQADHFKTSLGINSLKAHFIKLNQQVEAIVSRSGDEVGVGHAQEAEEVLFDDRLFREVVVQRSRAYVKASQEQAGETGATFPEREEPRVKPYSIKRTYGDLLKKVESAFSKDRPLFSLAIYAPLNYLRKQTEAVDAFERGRQDQVVGLIRTLFLKRFESSVSAFELSCVTLFLKLIAWAKAHSVEPADADRLERWTARHKDLIDYALERRRLVLAEDEEDDGFPEELVDGVEVLDPDKYVIEEILAETYQDLDQLAEFLNELRRFEPKNDDKLEALIKLLRDEEPLKGNKVLVFTEFKDTARYLQRHLTTAGIAGLDEVDSGNSDRNGVIRRFAPYYNGTSTAGLAAGGLAETRVLISTDVLAEGLNLQDATFLINYDLHWNPVRLMQRIGRVDRRLNPATEARILHDHPERAATRGHVEYWNFLPPEELDRLLKLYKRVAHKTLRISKIFGIEGRKLLSPTDDFEALREFNAGYAGVTSPEEQMLLEYQRLQQEHPGLAEHLDALPGRLFSGKAGPNAARAVFFSYALPGPKPTLDGNGDTPPEWVPDYATGWYLLDLDSGAIRTEPGEIVDVIRSEPATPRRVTLTTEVLREAREKVEKEIRDKYLRAKQAPIGAKATLRAWMSIA